MAIGLQEFFISKEACRSLGIVENGFTRVGAHGSVFGASRKRSSSAPLPLTDQGSSSPMPKGSELPLGTVEPTMEEVKLVFPNYDAESGAPDDVFDGEEAEKASSSSNEIKDAKGRELAPCGCLKRSLPHPLPKEPPFAAVPENVDKLEAWLREYYAASTFNTCKHQPLPMMKGADPLRIFMKEDAVLVAVH